MTYRKFKADYLFTGEEIAGGGLAGENQAVDMVLITTEDGTVQDLIPAADAGEGIEIYRGLLSPGFINCHCPLELSHMKGVLPEKRGLVDFLTVVIQQGGAVPAGGEHMARAEQEMLDNGMVAVGDICNTAGTLSLKTEGRLYYHNFIETMGFIEQSAGDRFAHSLGVFKAFAEAYSLPIEANSIVPHAPYSVSSALFRLVAGFPGNHILTIHNQESAAENEFYLSGTGDFLRLYQQLGLDVSFFQGTGKRSLASYVSYFHHHQSLILVHNVATSEEDLLAVRGVSGWAWPSVYFCPCSYAQLYISGLF